MGRQKLGLVDLHWLQLTSLTQSIYNRTTEKKHTTMGSWNSWFHWQSTCYHGITSITSWFLTLSPRLSHFFFFFSRPKKNLPYSASSSLFIGTFLILIPTAVLLPTKHSGIFFFTLSISSPPLSLICLLGDIFYV